MVRSSTRHFKSSVRKNKYKRNNIKKYSNRKRGGGKFSDLLRNNRGSNKDKPVAKARVRARATARATVVPTTNTQGNTLKRFLDAQRNGIESGKRVSDRTGTYNLDPGGTTYDNALKDLKNGSKPIDSHWIWYCFPQFHAGTSSTHRYFQIHDTTEAFDYFNNETLKTRYITLSQLVLDALNSGSNIKFVMGSDDIKLYSSLYLFNLVAIHLEDKVSSKLFGTILKKFDSTYSSNDLQIKKKFSDGLAVYLTSGKVQAPRAPRAPQAPSVDNVGLALQNGGNQCYMNAVIQAFTSIPSIQAKILALDNLEVRPMLYNLKEIIIRKNEKIVLRNSEALTNRLNPNQLSPIERIKHNIINIDLDAPQDVTEQYSYKLTEKLRSENIDKLKIIALSCPSINKEHVPGSTEDNLIRLIIEEATSENSKSNFNFIREDVDKFKGRRQQDSSEFLSFLLNYIEFREYFILDRIIEDNKYMCGGCPQYSKHNYERHNKLEIPIYGNSVQDSINQYCRQEEIQGRCDDDYINDSGGVFGDSDCIGNERLIKSIGLGIFPEVLIISLGRFGEGVVRINVEGEEEYQGEKITREIEITPVININGQEYNLQAVVYHYGVNTKDGHYTADCLVGGHWINYNDETTSYIDQPRDNRERQSYILFYTLGRHVGAQVGVQSPRPLPQIDLPPYSQSEEDIARYESVLELAKVY